MSEQIGHYRILRKIGEGGMGEVFCAQDLKLGRNVALKILPVKLAEDVKRLSRFLREARMASTLSHPNITHIYEVGEENGIHFIAMEYVEGETLQEKIRHGPLENFVILNIALQIAEALLSAHEAKIVHRDIKPANIMLSSQDRVKILDFGLAKQDWSDRADIDQISTDAFTQAGTLLGTVHYVSPEQALGKEVDQRSDIFSFGVVLYEMATGQRPFSGTNATTTIAHILTVQPESAQTRNPQLHSSINQIIEKCLRKNPNDRYQSVKDLIRDFSSIRDGTQANLVSDQTEKEYSISRGLARTLFLAIQIMYLVFYLCALRWSDGMESSLANLLGTRAASYLAVAFILTAVLGIAIRLHLLFLVVWDHVAAGVQFRKVFPLIFALDGFWAFAPFGLLNNVPGIFLMACVPPLAFSAFSQRTLMRTAYDLHSQRRIQS